MTAGELFLPTARQPRRRARRAAATASAIGLLAIAMVALSAPAGAAAYENSVGLGTAGPYSVLAGQTVTNTGPSILNGSVGVSPGTAITGFPPGIVGGATHAADAAAAQAESDLTTAYLDAAGRTPTGTALGGALAGGTLQPGVYAASSTLLVNGTVTLDGQGNPNSVFIFQVAAALNTASSTTIALIGNAQPCNVFWQVGTSATLGTGNTFVGTIMALTSISLNTGTHVAGRALARNGSVTLDTNTFTSAACASTPTTTTVTTTPSTAGTTTTLTATVTAPGAIAPTGGTVTFRANGVVVGTAPVGPNGVATLTVPASTIPGTETVTATFSGLISYAPSTSTATNLVITPVPTLPSTGTDHIGALTSAGGGAALLGLILVLAARFRSRTPAGSIRS